MGNTSSKQTVSAEPDTLIALTQRAYDLAIAATHSASDLILGAKAGIGPVAECERELDELDREIDERVATDTAQAPLEQVREKLACLKCVIDLERVGDLLLSFATRADTVHTRLDMQDLRDFGDMLAVLSKMLAETEKAFAARDHARALEVLRTDREVDRLHNLIVMRRLEPEMAFSGPDSIHT